jgi:toxin ParE1/3/4
VKVSFGRHATAQLARIFSHVAQDNPRAAAEVVDRIEQIAASLSEFPEKGRTSSTMPRLRWIKVPGYPYLVFYTILTGNTVRIVRVLHGARQRQRP